MPSKRILILTSAIWLTTACSHQPWVAAQPLASQQKISAAQQWGLIAEDVTEQTRLALLKADYLETATPVYVSESTNAHFDRGFRNYLITSLVNAGFNVATQQQGAIEIQYESQVIRHGDSFDPGAMGYQPGVATAGAAGLWVLRNASPTSLAASIVAGTDAYLAVKPTNVELLLTTSIVQGNRYLMRNTDAYYIEDADAYLFEPCRGKSLRGCRPKQF